MKIFRKSVALILAIAIAFSCAAAFAAAATPKIKSMKIVQLPSKLTYYKGTDWDYGYWKMSAGDDGSKGVFVSNSKTICFMHNGGYYSYYSDIGMLDMNGLVVEVSYSDGSKKKVEYKETISGNKVTQNILFSPAEGYFTTGKNEIEIYFKENLDVYTTFTITLSTSKAVKGDINDDRVVNSADALMVLKHVVGVSTLTGAKLTAADVNTDKKVNSVDALEILKIAVA